MSKVSMAQLFDVLNQYATDADRNEFTIRQGFISAQTLRNYVSIWNRANSESTGIRWSVNQLQSGDIRVGKTKGTPRPKIDPSAWMQDGAPNHAQLSKHSSAPSTASVLNVAKLPKVVFSYPAMSARGEDLDIQARLTEALANPGSWGSVYAMAMPKQLFEDLKGLVQSGELRSKSHPVIPFVDESLCAIGFVHNDDQIAEFGGVKLDLG